MDEHRSWRPGDRVRHRLQPSWGVGEVRSIEGEKLHVSFVHGGERVLLRHAPLDRLDSNARSSQATRDPDPAFSLGPGRGRRVDALGACSVCGCPRRPLWYYPSSTQGAVHLCVPCKQRGLDARDGKRDILDLPPARLATSAFELSKRR